MNSCAPIFTTDTSFPSIYASQEGEFEIVKWLHENGCPCNRNSYRAARENNHWRIEKWIEQQFDVERRRRRKNSLDVWTWWRLRWARLKLHFLFKLSLFQCTKLYIMGQWVYLAWWKALDIVCTKQRKSRNAVSVSVSIKKKWSKGLLTR